MRGTIFGIDPYSRTMFTTARVDCDCEKRGCRQLQFVRGYMRCATCAEDILCCGATLTSIEDIATSFLCNHIGVDRNCAATVVSRLPPTDIMRVLFAGAHLRYAMPYALHPYASDDDFDTLHAVQQIVLQRKRRLSTVDDIESPRKCRPV